MIIADTEFFIAIGNRRDQDHLRAVQILASLDEPLITTYPVITETCCLLSARAGHVVQCNFFKEFVAGAFEVFSLRREHVKRMIELMECYADLPMDLADASLVVLAENLKHGRILTTDRRDFSIYRWNKINSFENWLN
jgi:uncharacterized protein